MKKALLILLALVMALSLFACKDNTSSDGGQTGNTPTGNTPTGNTQQNSPPPSVGVAPEPPPEGAQFAEHIEIMQDAMITAVIDAFNPAGDVASTHWIYTMFTDKLMVYNEADGSFEPQLATEWSTNDNQTFIFHLRDDVYFHNGDHFTAEDVKWTIEISREFPASVVYDRWSAVAEANVIDPYTIELVLHAPNTGFYSALVWPVSGIYSSRAYREQPDNWTWIGTGPYIVTDFSTGAYTALTRNDDWWGGVMPTKTITFRNVIEEAVRPLMMLDGDFDYSLGINPDDLDLFDDSPDFQLIRRRLNSPICINFNMSDPLMSDLNFRMAVIHSLNGGEMGLVAEGERGYAEMTELEGGVWGFATAYRKTDIPRPQQDLDLARQYLAQSSYNGETIVILNPGAALSRGAAMLQTYLEQIGVNCVVDTTDQPSMMAQLGIGNNQSHIHVFPCPSDLNPFSMVRNNYTVSSANRTSYINPEIEELFARASASTDPEVHRAVFYEIQDIVSGVYNSYPIFWKDFTDVAKSGVSGFILSAQSQFHNFRGIYRLLDD